MSAGFDRAPITRFLVGVCGVSSVISLFFSSRRKIFALTLGDIVDRFQFWRFFTTHIFFGSAAELVLGLLLLYNFRLFERHFGARKYGGAIFFFLIAASLLDLALLAAIPSEYFSATATGPYAIVFALLPSFIIDIPKIAPFKVFGIPLSEKFFTYLLAAQLAFAAPTSSFFTAAIAFIVGALYRWERLPFHKLRVPAALMRFCERTAQQMQLAVSGGENARYGGGGRVGAGQGYSLRGAGQAAGNGNGSAGQNSSNSSPSDFGGYVAGSGAANSYERLPLVDNSDNPASASNAASVLPNAQGVSQLVSMGFGELESRTALSASNNNVEAAMNLLLASR